VNKAKHERQTGEESNMKFWLWEVWLDNRQIFKTLVGDLFAFLFLMALISLGHYIILAMPLTEQRRELLERWHFVVIFSVWIFLSVTLFIEIIIAVIRKIRSSENKT
jgi:hypothetical protein